MRRDFEGAKLKQEDGILLQNSLKQPNENLVSCHQTKEKWEKGHKEATMELLKVKDRAIELERNVSFVLYWVSLLCSSYAMHCSQCCTKVNSLSGILVPAKHFADGGMLLHKRHA